MKKLGVALVAIGALIAIMSFGYDTAPEGTHNIGLMQSQMMFFHLGGVLIIVGTLLLGTALVIGRLEDAGILPPAGLSAPTLPPEADL